MCFWNRKIHGSHGNALEMPIEELSQAAFHRITLCRLPASVVYSRKATVITHVNEGEDRLDIFAAFSLS